MLNTFLHSPVSICTNVLGAEDTKTSETGPCSDLFSTVAAPSKLCSKTDSRHLLHWPNAFSYNSLSTEQQQQQQELSRACCLCSPLVEGQPAHDAWDLLCKHSVVGWGHFLADHLTKALERGGSVQRSRWMIPVIKWLLLCQSTELTRKPQTIFWLLSSIY